ncbi:hypothetical protein [Natronoglomus mannanivorans]|uniref:Uncharacterized protein n=1 Tax=Natronoglomus mannanivorans TaxID=2979990 RepID=A0AAP3E2P6_9EURY|nr:hypothetical protein [Halobacteria archaeon AArc-xg1-1]
MTDDTPFTGDSRVLHRRAIRIPLPDEASELAFHRTMQTVADAQERKAKLMADPQTSVLEAYERQLEGIADSFEHALRDVVGEEYETIAHAYSSGRRNDGLAAMAAYLFEALWRFEQMSTITERTFFPVVLRYPRCDTVNVRFVNGHVTENAVLYESPAHSTEQLADRHEAQYHNESHWSQKQAARQIEANAQLVREAFPDPQESDFEERRSGGIVAAFGRRGSEFSSAVERVESDPDRFSETIDEPELVVESPVAKRTEREWLPDDAVVL